MQRVVINEQFSNCGKINSGGTTRLCIGPNAKFSNPNMYAAEFHHDHLMKHGDFKWHNFVTYYNRLIYGGANVSITIY